MMLERDLSLLISDPMCVLDPEGRIVQLNEPADVLLSWDRSRVPGSDHHDLWPFNGFEFGDCPVCEALDKVRTGLPLGAATLTLTISEQQRYFHVTYIPLWNAEGFVGLGLILFDRTREQHQHALVCSLWAILQHVIGTPGGGKRGTVGIQAERPGGIGTNYGPTLTWREREVLHCMVAGLNARGIAARLSVTHHTARNHVRNVLHKLEAHSKAQAVAHALILQLIDAQDLATILAEVPRQPGALEQSA